MRLFPASQTREEYFRTQIERSETKFRYCKVSIADAVRYQRLVADDRAARGARGAVGPVVCLGTRNGREVDLFRIAFSGSAIRRAAVALMERRSHSFVPMIPALEASGRCAVAALDDSSVVGVEINPRGARDDVWTGSFDELPSAWTGRFGVVYSNSLDQSQDPARTAREWLRITRPGGYVVVAFSKDVAPSATDPVGGLALADVRGLFGGELVCYRDRGSRAGHCEAILRMDGVSA